MRYTYITLIILTAVFGLYGQNNTVPLRHMVYAPGINRMVVTNSIGQQTYVLRDSIDQDTRLTAAWQIGDTLYMQVSRVSGAGGLVPIDTVKAAISSGGGNVYVNAGTGIQVTGSGSFIDPFVITNASPDLVVSLTAGTAIGVSGTYPNFTITNTSPDQMVSITGAGINTVGGSYPNFTITGTEVDGSITNEGRLGVGAGGANTATLTTNTSGSNAVTFAGGTGVAVTETTSTNGGTITITNSAPDQTVTINAGTGISSTGTYPNFTVTNTAPDQTVVINGSTGITASGTYPTFNLSVADQSPTNEIQTLAISNDTLSISSGNFVVLPQPGSIDTATFLFQDSILIYSVNGVEFGRDTIRTPGGGGPGSVDTLNYLAIVSDTLYVGDTRDTLSVFLDYYPNSNPAGFITSFTDTSGYNQAFFINSDTLYIEDGLTGYGVYLGNYINTDTSGYNNLFSLSGQTLSIGDDNDTLTVTLPIVGVSAGTGISVNTTAGVATVTNTSPDQTVTLTGQSGINTSGTYPAFTIAADTAGILATQYYVNSQGFLTGNQTITLSGDVTGSGATSITTTIAANAVSNAKLRQSAGLSVIGRSANSTGDVADITAGADNLFLVRRSSTLGFGSLTAADIPDLSATYYLASNPAGYTTNTGTVTSVGLSLPAQFNVTNSPVTGAGTLTGAWVNQNANIVFAGPASGGAAAPTFRSLVSDDIPSLDMAKITTGNLAWSRISTTPTTLSGYGITDAVANTRNVATSGSLTGGGNLSADRTLSLVNDNASPGNSKYYGTDASGVKGFHDVPGAGGGEANTASNLGSGYGVWANKTGVDLRFKSLVPGEGVKMDSTSTEITISRENVIAPFDTTATAYTLALTDMDRRILFSSGSNVTVTIPLNSSVPFPLGTVLTMYRYGTGELEVAATGGVTLNSASGYKRANVRYQALELYKVDTDTWILIGDLKL